jgi:mRNA export factor
MATLRQRTETTSVLSDLSKDATLTSPPEDTISSLSWSSKADFLGVGSWDHKVRIYDMTSRSTGEGRAAIDFDGPVLSCDWSLASTNSYENEVA